MTKSLQFQLKGNSYTVEFPNNKEYIAIQNAKAALAPNYDMFRFMGAEGTYAELLVDASSHLSILCPSLVKDLAKPILELSMVEGRELTQEYANQFRPWYNDCLDFVFAVNKKEVTTPPVE